MDSINSLFLEALSASINNKQVQWNRVITREEWTELFRMADIHHVLPMVYEAVCDNESITAVPDFALQMKCQAIKEISMQAMRTYEFQRLYEYLQKNGIALCVVKGVICRNLYPNPDARVSEDEDIFISPEQFSQCHDLLTQYGMVLSDPNTDMEKDFEVSYAKEGSLLYIEVHKHMFLPDAAAYGNFNCFFDGIHKRKTGIHAGNCGVVEEEIKGTEFQTMNPTDHLLYLIMHSFKHFFHSGFGLRQVCDIALYAMKNGHEIDWDYVLRCCQEIRADLFAAAIFRICEKYLDFEPEKAGYPDPWRSIQVDERAMLEDLLKSGVYGQADMSRRHSSNITLNALIADKRGGKVNSNKLQAAMNAVFLPADKLSDRFTYLQKHPVLLPVAWIQRLWTYRMETVGNKAGNNAAESIRIGNERVELMRQYGIIK